jgi:CRISPR-associated Cas5-like protein
MRALVLKITFSEALFKTHYTKGFRQTYPIPLPVSVAGIFGALLGIKRGELIEHFRDYMFGAKLLKHKGVCPETTTYIQYKGGKRIRGVAISIIQNNPSFAIALVNTQEKVKEIYNKIKNGIVFLPYGGQNDFFTEDIEIIGIKDAEETLIVENYAPQDLVEKIEWDKGTEFQVLPVRHKFSPNPNFYFIFNGRLLLKKPIWAVDGIGVFSLENFYYLHQETNVRG